MDKGPKFGDRAARDPDAVQGIALTNPRHFEMKRWKGAAQVRCEKLGESIEVDFILSK